MGQISDLRAGQEEAQNFMMDSNIKPKALSVRNITTFFSKLRYSIVLTFQEKEIIVLAILQWLFVIIACILWTKGFAFIPDELWQRTGESIVDDGNKAKSLLIIILWSLTILIIVNYPISICSAAIIASQYLKHSNQESTIAKCIAIALRSSGRIWFFTFIDAWITCETIIARRKRRVYSGAKYLYYAWKISTAPVLPALVAGKTFFEATKDSFTILKKHPLQLIGIRMGYSFTCWIVAIACYIGIFYLLGTLGKEAGTIPHYIYNSYLLIVLPIFFSIFIVSVIVRPHFLIMMAKLYNEVITQDNEAVNIEQNSGSSLFFAKLFLTIFILLFAALVFSYFYGDTYFQNMFRQIYKIS